MHTESESMVLPPYRPLVAGHMEFEGSRAVDLPDPIGIGAVGGSGTRVLADILKKTGVALGTPLNQAGDAAEWPPYEQLLAPANRERHSRATIMRNTYLVFERLLLQRRQQLGLSGRVGWKVPGTFHWLEDLAAFFPGFQYVHVMRNGLDMAYSRNQSQVGNWGSALGVEIRRGPEGRVLPRTMLEYWLTANERALESGRRCLCGNMLVLRFEDLCSNPRPELYRLLDFLKLETAPLHLEKMGALVRAPASIGRHRNFNWQSEFSDSQLQRLEKLGYHP